MQVWDTAGQERFRTITQSYYRSAHGAIIAYDITRRSTFDSVTHWIKEVELYGATNVVLVLIGESVGCDWSHEYCECMIEVYVLGLELEGGQNSIHISEHVIYSTIALHGVCQRGLM